MGSGVVKSTKIKIKEFKISNYDTYIKEGQTYWIIDRDKYKLSQDVLLNFEKFNNFSRDQELPINNINTKSTFK